MKGLLLLLLALVVWCIGGTLAVMIGDFWFRWLFSGVTTTWGYVWRWALLSPIHIIVLSASYYVVGFALVVSPYRKVVAIIALACALMNLWGSLTDLGVGQSLLVHIVGNAIIIYLSVIALISKAPYVPWSKIGQEQV